MNRNLAIITIAFLTFTTIYFASASKAQAYTFTQQQCYQMSQGDIDHSGVVNIHDLSILLTNFKKST